MAEKLELLVTKDDIANFFMKYGKQFNEKIHGHPNGVLYDSILNSSDTIARYNQSVANFYEEIISVFREYSTSFKEAYQADESSKVSSQRIYESLVRLAQLYNGLNEKLIEKAKGHYIRLEQAIRAQIIIANTLYNPESALEVIENLGPSTLNKDYAVKLFGHPI